MVDEGRHAACVDAWLTHSAAASSPEALLRLFENAMGALWIRTKTTLGEVTLTAIAERVLHNASERFSLLWSLKVGPAGGIQCRELRERIGSVQPAELREAVRFILVEFLTVLGNLTAEILTAELHAELHNVSLPRPIRVSQDLPRQSSDSSDAASAAGDEKTSWRR